MSLLVINHPRSWSCNYFVVELYVFICLQYCIVQNKKCIPFSKCNHVLVCRCLIRAYDSNRMGSPSCSRNTAMYLCIAIFTAVHSKINKKSHSDWVCKGLWPVWLGRGRRQYQGHTGWWRKRKWEQIDWKCDPSMSPVRLRSTKLKMCHQYRIALKPKMLWSSFYTLYSPSECTTARYFRVGRCLMRHRSPQERGSPEQIEKVYFTTFSYSILFHLLHLSLSLSFPPPHRLPHPFHSPLRGSLSFSNCQ